jgi:transcriptional regulator GlxA family with amidase domain
LSIFSGVSMNTVALLAVQNCMYSSITGPFDLFSVAASESRRLSGIAGPLFQPIVVAPANREITAFNGMPVQAGAFFSDERVYDIVVVPVIFGDLEPLLTDRETIDWLTRQGRRGACLCSVCAGAFLLAQTGLLKGRKATTHWNLADSFARRFPEVILKREKMLIDEGDCITAGGVSAYLDLSLYLIARFGSLELAALLSRILLIDPTRHLQSPYQTCSFNKSHGDAEILAIQKWLEDNFAEPITLHVLAGRVAMGERTFMRRFKKATGDTPLEYLQQLRIEAARKLLETTFESIDGITRKSGYEDISSFRKLFKKYTGLSPSAYRRKFSCLV